jgi:hypothetical protein
LCLLNYPQITQIPTESVQAGKQSSSAARRSNAWLP